MTDSNTVQAGLATLGASGWVVNERISKAPLVSPPVQNTAVILGDSRMARGNASIAVAAANVVGDGSTTTITTAGQAVLDGRVSLSQSGSAFLDHKIFQATNVDANVFTIKSGLNGTPPSPVVITIHSQISERGWFPWLNAKLGGRFMVLNYAAIGGEVVTDWIARLQTDVLNYKPATCFIGGPINDCAAGTDPATILARLMTVWQMLNAAGIAIVQETVAPLFTGHANFAVATPIRLRLNRLIRAQCLAQNVPCVDSDAAIQDMTPAALASAITNALDTDNIHYSAYGARLMAEAAQPVVSSLWSAPSILAASPVENITADALSNQLIDTSPWAAAGVVNPANVTGTVATGFTLQRTAGAGLVTGAAVVQRTVGADGDAIGFNQVFVMTSAGAGETWQLFPASIRSRLVIGGQYRFGCKIKLSGTAGANLRGIQFQMALAGAAQSAIVRAWGNESTLNVGVTYADEILTFISPLFTVPSWFLTATAGFPILQFTFGAAGTALTVSAGRFFCERVA